MKVLDFVSSILLREGIYPLREDERTLSAFAYGVRHTSVSAPASHIDHGAIYVDRATYRNLKLLNLPSSSDFKVGEYLYVVYLNEYGSFERNVRRIFSRHARNITAGYKKESLYQLREEDEATRSVVVSLFSKVVEEFIPKVEKLRASDREKVSDRYLVLPEGYMKSTDNDGVYLGGFDVKPKDPKEVSRIQVVAFKSFSEGPKLIINNSYHGLPMMIPIKDELEGVVRKYPGVLDYTYKWGSLDRTATIYWRDMKSYARELVPFISELIDSAHPPYS